jgi:hypothetical protein
MSTLRTGRAFKRGRPDARLAVLTPASPEAFGRSIPEVDELVPFAPDDSLFCNRKEDTRAFRGSDSLSELAS